MFIARIADLGIADSVHYFAIDVSLHETLVAHLSGTGAAEFRPARPSLFSLVDTDASLAACGKSMLEWNARNVCTFPVVIAIYIRLVLLLHVWFQNTNPSRRLAENLYKRCV